ncbi:predicted protein [Botrytis cinerea T4]|uniref:Uncharacterized protein n=1 Tax=Botryotinia fuckeliana (strain T4) TaxID=999810 RepID=G2YJG4_BOTF4|nr:predicted protein [Botrytis cinerea T4]
MFAIFTQHAKFPPGYTPARRTKTPVFRLSHASNV